MTKKGFVAKIKESATLKVIVIGFLVLILLIPASMVNSRIRERERRSRNVIYDISSKWGQEQTISGPVISLPYNYSFEDEKGKKQTLVKHVHILPDTLDISSDITTEIRYRGIYECVLYNTKINLTGEFLFPDFEKMGIREKDILWERASVAVGISDMRGVKENISAKINDKDIEMNPGIETKDVLSSGISAKIPVSKKDKKIPFTFDLDINGSQRISFTPIGKITSAEVTSKWQDPSFDGSFLPTEREVTDKGFTAKWKVLHLNRDYPQYWSGPQYKISGSAFGIKLFLPTDAYQKTERTSKYAIMFIALTFMAFFVSETMNRIKIHPIQYLLIGLALVIFYTLLLSIAEHIGFGKAYIISSASIIMLITSYSRSVLRNKVLSFMVFCILTILYIYLYILMQLEDFALMLGSIGLFVILAVVMFVTRRINWYAVSPEEE